MLAQVCNRVGLMMSQWFFRQVFSWLIVLLMALFVVKTASAVGAETGGFETVLCRDGAPQCLIVIAGDSSPKVLELAQELAYWLKEISGAEFAVSQELVDRAIVLGTWEQWHDMLTPSEQSPEASEAYRIRTDGQKVWIIARTELGLQHAIYDFLESLGCRWYFPDPVWTVIPRSPTLVANLDRTVSPAFEYRRIWYGWGPRTEKLSADYQNWLRHNRQLGHFQIACGHSYDSHIAPRHFAEHPEWFSYVEGRRQPYQLCTSNPEVQRRVVEHVLAVFRNNPGMNMVSVEPNDGDKYCECEACLALGTPSDRVFHLANVVADAVRREFPDKWVGLYAYAGHSEPPHFPLKPGVYVQVTTGFRYTKLSFEEQVEAFRKLGARVGVYDYFSVYPWDWDMPGAAKASRIFELAKAIRHYYQLGSTTYDAESSCNWGPNGLGYWMAAHLMWDPNLDPEMLFRDFCERAFGPAGDHVARIYRRWTNGERFSQRNLKLALLDLEQAYAAVSEPAIRNRLDRIAMYLHWLRLWSDYDHSAKWNQWGKLAVASPDEIVARAAAFAQYTQRIMDTGLVHAYPALHSEWFRHRLAALNKIPNFDWDQTKAWINDAALPTQEEVARSFREDLKSLQSLPAVEIRESSYGNELVPLVEHIPEVVKEWKQVPTSKIAVESGLFIFRAEEREKISLEYRPYDKGHTINCHWSLANWPDVGQRIVDGQVKAAKGENAVTEVSIPNSGLFAFDPGTAYWRAAEIRFPPHPLSLWAGRPQGGTKSYPPLRLWRPTLDQPLYVFVPKGTTNFILGIVEGGDPYTTVQIRTPAGKVLCDQRLLAGDQLSVILRDPTKNATKSGSLNEGIDGRGMILSLGLDSLRCVIEIYNIPPFVARHPAELLVPKDEL
ncbi:MAG: DUF4838 domain-containing protein [Thermogutta sp.]